MDWRERLTKILTFCDAHCEAEQNLTRFFQLGKLIVRERPDVIVNLGDFVSFESISGWNSNKRLSLEGQRYEKEIKTGNEALDAVEGPLRELQARQSRLKVRQYKPELHFVKGNHEDRVDRYIQENPELAGFLSVDKNLSLSERGWAVTPYRSYTEVEGIMFTHVPMMGNNQPVSGANVVRNALRILSKSTVWGHHHYIAQDSVKRHGSDALIQGLTAGCFFEEESEYMIGGNNNHSKGVVMLDVYRSGRFAAQAIPMERIYEY